MHRVFAVYRRDRRVVADDPRSAPACHGGASKPRGSAQKAPRWAGGATEAVVSP